eukprot:scaffold48853_cov55-Phaeocystis_antarctica.AAC.4
MGRRREVGNGGREARGGRQDAGGGKEGRREREAGKGGRRLSTWGCVVPGRWGGRVPLSSSRHLVELARQREVLVDARRGRPVGVPGGVAKVELALVRSVLDEGRAAQHGASMGAVLKLGARKAATSSAVAADRPHAARALDAMRLILTFAGP